MRSPVEGPKIRDLLDRCDVVLTERKSKDFNTKDIDQVRPSIAQKPSNARHGHQPCQVQHMSIPDCIV